MDEQTIEKCIEAIRKLWSSSDEYNAGLSDAIATIQQLAEKD